MDLFIDETKEHLQSLNEHVLVLEKEPEDADTINEIFRAAHTLKGMAGTMGFARMQRLTHDLENVFSEIRNGNMKANAKLIDVLFRGLDALESYLDVISSEGNEGTEDNQDIIDDLNSLLQEQSGGAPAAPEQKTEKKKDNLRRNRKKRTMRRWTARGPSTARFLSGNLRPPPLHRQGQKGRIYTVSRCISRRHVY
jgi:two-component system chemotaxis sensor kinase CheA